MTFAARLHPVLVHFPIALIVIAAFAEGLATATGDRRWRIVAIADVRLGAMFAIVAAAAGWRLASGIEPTAVLQWHRWLGLIAAAATLSAAAATTVRADRSSAAWIYRISLVSAASLIAIAGHLGGLLVWGADFFRP